MKEEIFWCLFILTLILTLIAILAFGTWWSSVGAERSEYKFCVSEYLKNDPKNQSGAFRYCYDETF